MAICDWPEDQRPRERLIAYGPEALSDPELIAIFLRTGSVGKSAIDLGRDIIARFGRFPHRNGVPGRETTGEELAYLEDGGFRG